MEIFGAGVIGVMNNLTEVMKAKIESSGKTTSALNGRLIHSAS